MRREQRQAEKARLAALGALGLFSASRERREAAIAHLIAEQELSEVLGGFTARQVLAALSRKPAVQTIEGAVIRLSLAKMVLAYSRERGLRFSDCWNRGGYGRLLRITTPPGA